MSRDQGSKQTIILHNCLTRNEKYDLVITPHKQTIGVLRSKRQTRKKTKITKQKQNIKKQLSKRRNAIWESETNTIQELQDLKDSTNTKKPLENKKGFSDSKATSQSSIIGKRKIKLLCIKEPVRFYNWNQPIRHKKSYITTCKIRKVIECRENFDNKPKLLFFI